MKKIKNWWQNGYGKTTIILPDDQMFYYKTACFYSQYSRISFII